MAAESPEDKTSFVARFTDGFLALIGAKSRAEFAASFQAAWTGIVSRIDTLEKTPAAAAFDVKPFEARIAAMELALKDAPTKANVESWAAEAGKVAGSSEAIKAVAGVGLHPSVVTGAAPTTTATQPETEVQTLISAGKFTEAWAKLPADHKDKKDFASAERYAAYQSAVVGGRIAVFQQEKK